MHRSSAYELPAIEIIKGKQLDKWFIISKRQALLVLL